MKMIGFTVEIIFYNELIETVINFESHKLRIDVLESEVKYANRPFVVAIVDVHQTTLKSIDWLFQQLPRCLVLLRFVLVFSEVVSKSIETEEFLYECDAWIYIHCSLTTLFQVILDIL